MRNIHALWEVSTEGNDTIVVSLVRGVLTPDQFVQLACDITEVVVESVDVAMEDCQAEGMVRDAPVNETVDLSEISD